MLVGVRAGFDHLMGRFNPEQLEEVFSKQGRRGLFGGAKPWEMYSGATARWRRMRDEAFRRLFGEEFARAYEQQLAVLKRGRMPRRDGAMKRALYRSTMLSRAARIARVVCGHCLWSGDARAGVPAHRLRGEAAQARSRRVRASSRASR